MVMPKATSGSHRSFPRLFVYPARLLLYSLGFHALRLAPGGGESTRMLSRRCLCDTARFDTRALLLKLPLSTSGRPLAAASRRIPVACSDPSTVEL